MCKMSDIYRCEEDVSKQQAKMKWNDEVNVCVCGREKKVTYSIWLVYIMRSDFFFLYFFHHSDTLYMHMRSIFDFANQSFSNNVPLNAIRSYVLWLCDGVVWHKSGMSAFTNELTNHVEVQLIGIPLPSGHVISIASTRAHIRSLQHNTHAHSTLSCIRTNADNRTRPHSLAHTHSPSHMAW